MPRKRQATSIPKAADTSRLINADGLRWYLSDHPVYRDMTDVQLGAKLGLSAGYVGMVRSGTRPPSKAFLDAIGWESMTLYRRVK